MKIDICRPCELSDTHVAKWHEFQQADEGLQNPFLSVEFARAVDLCRPDARVVVVEDGGDVVAFLPLSITKGSIARPIAPGFCDLQAIVHDPRWEANLLDVFHRSNLNAYIFDYHLGAQVQSLSGVRRSQNWLIDLSEGQDAYFGWLEEHHHNFFAKIRRNLRRLQRATGELEFRYDTASASDLQALMRLKSDQCQRLGWRDISAVTWVRNLVDQLLDTRAPWLTGTMSTLVADGSVISAEFCLRSRAVLAGWFMAYDVSFEARSPGLVGLYKLIEALSGTEVRHIDLGKGVEEFKRHVSNGTIEVAEVSITGSRPLGLLVGATSKVSYALRTEYPTLETKARQYVRQWRQHRSHVSNVMPSKLKATGAPTAGRVRKPPP
jgi:CelD/BcsL family acetyltransferase involved in cellulose biosynthesis